MPIFSLGNLLNLNTNIHYYWKKFFLLLLLLLFFLCQNCKKKKKTFYSFIVLWNIGTNNAQNWPSFPLEKSSINYCTVKHIKHIEYMAKHNLKHDDNFIMVSSKLLCILSAMQKEYNNILNFINLYDLLFNRIMKL